MKLKVASILLLAASHAQAFTIEFKGINDIDLQPNQDLWHYDYHIAGSLTQFESIELLFDPTNYGDLNIVDNLDSADWSTFITQPQSGLPADGIFNALAINNLPTVQTNFSIQFVWLGSAAPSEQPFVIYDSTFTVKANGTTRLAGAPIPAPSAIWLFASGLAAFRLPGFTKSRFARTRANNSNS